MPSKADPETPEVNQSASEPSPYSMTENILKERLHKPIYGNVWRQLFAGFLVCSSSCSFGNVLGWTHSVTREIVVEETSPFDEDELGWVTSSMLLGCSLGVTSCAFLLRQFGPKRALQVVGPFYILCWWLSLNTNAKTVARFFLGFLGITYFTAGESLMMQTVSYGLRRYWTVLHNSIMLFGVFAGHLIGTLTSSFVLNIICATLPMLHYVLIFLVPESPVFLYAKSAVEAAKSLKWYRGEENFYQDMADIKKDWDASRQDSEVYGYMMFHRVVFRPLFVIVALTFFQAAAAYLIFLFYSVETLSGGIALSTFIDSGIIALYFVFSKLLWGILHVTYSWRVRPLLITSCLLSAFCLALFATYLFLHDYDIDIKINLHWSPLFILGLYVISYDMGLNYYYHLLIFEYMPHQMFQKASLIISAIYWLFSFIMVFVFGKGFFDSPGYVYFYAYSGITFLGALFCYFCVVEPKGKSLIQIQLAFGGNPIGTRGVFYREKRRLTV